MADPPPRTPNSRARPKAPHVSPGPEVRARRSASAEGLSAIETALNLDEPATSKPLPRPIELPPPPQQKQPQARQDAVAARPIRRLADDPIKRSDYRTPGKKSERHFLGLIVAIGSMVAILVALGMAYWGLRR